MVDLNRLVRKATSDLILRALHTYSGAEVALAAGTSRQYTNRLKRRKATPSSGRKAS
jgi:hypothetical protein